MRTAGSTVSQELKDLALTQYFASNLMQQYSEDIDLSLAKYIETSDRLIEHRAVQLGYSTAQWNAAKLTAERAGDVLGHMGTNQPQKTAPAPDLTAWSALKQAAMPKIIAFACCATYNAASTKLLVRFASVAPYFDFLPYPIPI